MSLEKLYTTKEVAEVLGITPNALTVQRHLGNGPKFIRIGLRKIRYRENDIEAFIAGCTEDGPDPAESLQGVVA